MQWLKRYGLSIFSLALSAALLAVVIWQNARITQMSARLDAVRNDLEKRIDSEAAGWKEALSEPAPLMERSAVNVISIDRNAHILNLELSASESWREGGTVRTMVGNECYGITAFYPIEGAGSSAQVSIPLDVKEEVTFWLDSDNGDSAILCRFFSPKELLPVQLSYGGVDTVCHDGVFYWTEDFVKLSSGTLATVREPEFRLYRNGNRIASYPGFGTAKPELCYWNRVDGYQSPCVPGDEFTLYFACVDQWDLRYEFCMGGWVVTEDGNRVSHWPLAYVPTVMWPA